MGRSAEEGADVKISPRKLGLIERRQRVPKDDQRRRRIRAARVQAATPEEIERRRVEALELTRDISEILDQLQIKYGLDSVDRLAGRQANLTLDPSEFARDLETYERLESSILDHASGMRAGYTQHQTPPGIVNLLEVRRRLETQRSSIESLYKLVQREDNKVTSRLQKLVTAALKCGETVLALESQLEHTYESLNEDLILGEQSYVRLAATILGENATSAGDIELIITETKQRLQRNLQRMQETYSQIVETVDEEDINTSEITGYSQLETFLAEISPDRRNQNAEQERIVDTALNVLATIDSITSTARTYAQQFSAAQTALDELNFATPELPSSTDVDNIIASSESTMSELPERYSTMESYVRSTFIELSTDQSKLQHAYNIAVRKLQREVEEVLSHDTYAEIETSIPEQLGRDITRISNVAEAITQARNYRGEGIKPDIVVMDSTYEALLSLQQELGQTRDYIRFQESIFPEIKTPFQKPDYSELESALDEAREIWRNDNSVTKEYADAVLKAVTEYQRLEQSVFDFPQTELKPVEKPKGRFAAVVLEQYGAQNKHKIRPVLPDLSQRMQNQLKLYTQRVRNSEFNDQLPAQLR